MLTGTLLMMAASALQTDTSAQRRALTGCFRAAVTKAQEEKKAPADFDAIARTQCAAEITAFRSAIVSADVRAGRPRKGAEADADVQITDYVTSFSERLEPLGGS